MSMSTSSFCVGAATSSTVNLNGGQDLLPDIQSRCRGCSPATTLPCDCHQLWVIFVQLFVLPPFSHQLISFDCSVAARISCFDICEDLTEICQICRRMVGETPSSSKDWEMDAGRIEVRKDNADMDKAEKYPKARHKRCNSFSRRSRCKASRFGKNA
jgi:hypothetical protein